MGQALTFAIGGAILLYAAYVIWKNFARVKRGQCPGGCGSCGKTCAYRKKGTEEGNGEDERI